MMFTLPSSFPPPPPPVATSLCDIEILIFSSYIFSCYGCLLDNLLNMCVQSFPGVLMCHTHTHTHTLQKETI